MRAVNSTTVKALWATMTQAYGTSVIDKKDSALMKAVGMFLEAIGVQSQRSFLRRYTTTIGYEIYAPFTVGEGDNLLSQVVICAHEHQHVVIMEREGAAIYNIKYLASPASRAVYEAECYRANMELLWWWAKGTGQPYPESATPEALATHLQHYGCGDAEIRNARVSLEKAFKVVKKAGVSCQAAVDVIKFFGWV